MNQNILVQGGVTTLQRFLVEAVYLGVSAAITSFLTAIINNPALFQPMWSGLVLVAARLLLGAAANLANPAVKNA